MVDILLKCPIFKDFSEQELGTFLPLIKSRRQAYKKKEIVFHQGDVIHEVGVVLNGALNGAGVDLMGHANIVSHLEASDIFGEAYATTGTALMISIEAIKDSEILFLDANKILKLNNNKLNRNILAIISQKNLALSRKIITITPKNIRERVLTYLSMQAALYQRSSFSIPFDRQQLADYLLVDRSSLSHTLASLKEEGIIDYQKNRFTILYND